MYPVENFTWPDPGVRLVSVNGRSRTREVWDDLTHTSHFLTPPPLLRCLLSRFVLLTESLEQAKLLNVTFCLIRPPDAQ